MRVEREKRTQARKVVKTFLEPVLHSGVSQRQTSTLAMLPLTLSGAAAFVSSVQNLTHKINTKA